MENTKHTKQNSTVKSKDKRQLKASILLLFISIAMLFASVYAWYASNKSVDTGFGLSTNDANVLIKDEFKITRIQPGGVAVYNYRKDEDGKYYLIDPEGEWLLNDKGEKQLVKTAHVYNYKKDEDGEYYLIDPEGEWLLDGEGKKQPVNIGGLAPGEALEFEITFERGGSLVGKELHFDIIMFGINGRGKIEGTNFTILGAYRITMLDDEGKPLPGIWLDDYEDGNDPLSQQILSNGGVWNTGNEKTVCFRMTLDLTQLKDFNLPPNALSQKEFDISGVRMVITQTGQ